MTETGRSWTCPGSTVPHPVAAHRVEPPTHNPWSEVCVKRLHGEPSCARARCSVCNVTADDASPCWGAFDAVTPHGPHVYDGKRCPGGPSAAARSQP